MRILVLIVLVIITNTLAWPGFCQSHEDRTAAEHAANPTDASTPKHEADAGSQQVTHEDEQTSETTEQQPEAQATDEGTPDAATADGSTEEPATADQTSTSTDQPPSLQVKNYPSTRSSNNSNAASSQPKRKPHKVRRIKELDEYVSDVKEWGETSGVDVLFALFLTAIALKCADSLSNRILAVITRNKEGTELKKRVDTLSSVVRYVLIILICALSGTVILKELGIDIAPIIAGAGICGIAVGFGAQSLVKDVISGFFMLLEDQIRVGDVVQIGDKTGVVDKVTLRLIVLRDVSYNVHYIPNGEVRVITNMTKEYSGYILDVGVSYDEDLDRIVSVMKSIDEELRNDPEFGDMILEPLEIFGLEQFGDSKLAIRARTKTKAIKQWIVGREFKRRLKTRFNQLGIEMPNPIVSVYAMKGRDHPLGEGAPLEAAAASINNSASGL